MKLSKEQSLASFGLLAGGLAHDYNNMLTAMLGGIELILCEDISDSVRETARDIKATMLKAATLVHRMLSCATGAEAQPEPLDLNSAASDIVRIMRRAIPDNAVVNFTPTQPLPLINADVAMVWQIIMNLVANACDALEGKDGIVTVSTRFFNASPQALAGFKTDKELSAPRYVELAVSDTGCGMSRETLEKIFTPLFTTKEKGNGLGLASVYASAIAFGGAVKVESVEGKGTVFRVAFPAMAAAMHGDDEAQPLLRELPEPSASPNAASRQCAQVEPTAMPPAKPLAASPVTNAPCAGAATILVVDDDAAIVKLLKIILSRAGYGVATAFSGQQGLDAWKAAKGEIAMCLIDASMGAGR